MEATIRVELSEHARNKVYEAVEAVFTESSAKPTIGEMIVYEHIVTNHIIVCISHHFQAEREKLSSRCHIS